MLGLAGLVEAWADQFTPLLAAMNSRSHDIAHGSCYMIFESAPHDRFIQFSFERDCFHMDIPRSTLTRTEAAAISELLLGFFYLLDGPEYTLHNEDVDGHDPFRAVYFYGDERMAATHMARIMFSVWSLSFSATIHVTSASFGGAFKWESEHAVHINVWPA